MYVDRYLSTLLAFFLFTMNRKVSILYPDCLCHMDISSLWLKHRSYSIDIITIAFHFCYLPTFFRLVNMLAGSAAFMNRYVYWQQYLNLSHALLWSLPTPDILVLYFHALSLSVVYSLQQSFDLEGVSWNSALNIRLYTDMCQGITKHLR